MLSEFKEFIAKGIDGTDKALKLNPDYIDALTYKNILLRMKEVDLRPLKEDFQLLCFNCRAIWESEYPELKERKKERGKKGQQRWLRKKKEPREEEEIIPPPPQGIVEELKGMLKSSNKNMVEMAKRRLSQEFGLDLT